jgi:hypothetical protein
MCYTYFDKIGGTYGRRERCIQGFVGKTLRDENLKDLGFKGEVILKWIIKKWEGKVWNVLSWFSIGICGGHL